MSSEIRGWRFGDRVEWQDSPGNWHEAVIIGQREGHDCTEYEAILADGDRVAWYAFGRFRALLARTEAGADGAVAFRIALGDCIWQDRVFHAPSHDLAVERGTPIEYAYTRPQDASGDAEFSAAELESLAKCVLASVTPGGFHIPEGWNVLLDKLTAMQAKEAK